MAYIMSYVPDKIIEPLLSFHLASIGPSQSPRSISARRLTILRIARKLGKPVAVAEYPELLAWQASQHLLKKASMAAAVTHLACYGDWLVKHNHRSDNPARDLGRPKGAFVKDPHPMSEHDVSVALANAEPVMHTWVALGAFCGLRCMEIAAVSAADISDEKLLVHGKGDKERWVDLPEVLHRELTGSAYPSRGMLWKDEDGVPFTPSRVSRLVGRYFRGLDIDATAHGLRHRYGTELYRATRDVVYVKDMMGHASIETTMCYVRLVGDNKHRSAVESIAIVAA